MILSEREKPAADSHTDWRGRIHSMRWDIVVATLFCCAFVHLFALPFARSVLGIPYHVTSLAAGQDRRIDVYALDNDMGSAGLFYEVRQGSTILMERQYIGAAFLSREKTSFEALILDEGKLVAIYRRATPSRLDVICDFSSGEYWPCPRQPKQMSSDSEYAVRDRLVNRMRSLTNNPRYVSADQYRGSRDD